MTGAATRATYDIRAFEPPDESQVLALMSASLGGGPTGRRTIEQFRWKHYDNPFGRSLMLVAESDGLIVGFRALMRWKFCLEGDVVPAVTAVDTATHPEWQGKGIFKKLTLTALEDLRSETALVFNTPNGKSLPGYLKMGWERVGRVPVSLRLRRPLRVVRTLLARGDERHPRPTNSAPAAAEVLSDSPGAAAVLTHLAPQGIATRRTPDYLQWRYGAAPDLDYRAIRDDGGIVIFRTRARGSLWETTVAELLIEDRDVGAGARLLRKAAAAARVDHMTCHFSVGDAPRRAARHCGYVPTGRGITFVVNHLNPVGLDPTRLGSWSLSLGDLEVL